MIKTKKITCESSIDVKRFYLPAIITGVCPTCGNNVEMDLESDYLSYPLLNVAEGRHFYCSECENEWEFKLTLEISITTEGKNINIK